MDGLAKGLKGTYNKAAGAANLQECEQNCDNSNDCGSLAYCPVSTIGYCFLFAKFLSGSEQIEPNITITDGKISYYKKCNSRGKQNIQMKRI